MATIEDTTPVIAAKAARVRAALTDFLPDAQITEDVLWGGAPGDEQVILLVALPGCDWRQVMVKLGEFRAAWWEPLLADVGDDVCVVSK